MSLKEMILHGHGNYYSELCVMQLCSHKNIGFIFLAKFLCKKTKRH